MRYHRKVEGFEEWFTWLAKLQTNGPNVLGLGRTLDTHQLPSSTVRALLILGHLQSSIFAVEREEGGGGVLAFSVKNHPQQV